MPPRSGAFHQGRICLCITVKQHASSDAPNRTSVHWSTYVCALLLLCGRRTTRSMQVKPLHTQQHQSDTEAVQIYQNSPMWLRVHLNFLKSAHVSSSIRCVQRLAEQMLVRVPAGSTFTQHYTHQTIACTCNRMYPEPITVSGFPSRSPGRPQQHQSQHVLN